MTAMIFISFKMRAQLSPGPLTSAHADLEGMANCTQCHDIGQKVPDSKCLACHEEIQTLMDQNRGYHAHSTVREQECIDCHSEHHGRKFDMVRFDTENFDHDLTGYTLEGTHLNKECVECHNSDNINDPELKIREKTYLGLDHECLSCHDDYHQGSLSITCTECHDFNAFSPASRFDHDDTEYPLEGEHERLDCISCHEIQRRNGREYQVFAGIEFNDCVSCHEDPHGDIPGRCSTCHTESAFTNFIGQRSFNHNLTDFELKGSHQNTNCFDCHDRQMSVREIFSDHNSVAQNDCIRCHEDVHEDRFGTDCASCHSERSWLILNDDMEFNHSLTDFPLLGMHEGLDCAECHQENYTQDMAHAYCMDCHEDFHEGEFQEPGSVVDCESCHSVYEPFTYTSFGFDEHAETDFPLEGAHLATPCFACHLSEDEWQFRDIGSQCIDCHEDIHEDHIDPKYYPEKNCTNCHTTDAWSSIEFDHDLTDWSLEFSHAEVECRNCHYGEGTLSEVQSFNTLESACYACHEDIHNAQFEISGITDCSSCHISSEWSESIFDHSVTRFPLEGRHAEIDCKACHDTMEGEVRIYKIEKFECIDCHS